MLFSDHPGRELPPIGAKTAFSARFRKIRRRQITVKGLDFGQGILAPLDEWPGNSFSVTSVNSDHATFDARKYLQMLHSANLSLPERPS